MELGADINIENYYCDSFREIVNNYSREKASITFRKNNNRFLERCRYHIDNYD